MIFKKLVSMFKTKSNVVC